MYGRGKESSRDPGETGNEAAIQRSASRRDKAHMVHVPLQSLSSSQLLGISIYDIEDFDCSIRGTSCKAFSVVIQLGIMLLRPETIGKPSASSISSGHKGLRTIISSWAVSMGTESDTVADGCKSRLIRQQIRLQADN